MFTLWRIIQSLFNIYTTLILIYVLMSWIPRGAFNLVEKIRDVLAMLCEPYLGLFRRFIPPIAMIDFSPIVAILALQVVEWLLWRILF